MTVICPSCDARFRDPPADVLATRPLQCSKCEHEWVPAVQAEALKQITPPGLAPGLEAVTGPADQALATISTQLAVIVENDGSASDDDKSSNDEPVYVDVVASHSFKQARSRKRRSLAAGIACVLGVGIALVGARSTIVDLVPATGPLYAAVGLEKPGLTIGDVRTTKTTKDGIQQLIVRGEIANLADNTVPVPPIQLIMRNQNETDLYAWTVSAAKPELKAGETSRFTAIARNYPKKAVHVEVKFADLPK